MTVAVLDVVSDDSNIPLAQIQTDTGVSSFIYAKRISSNETYYLLLGSNVLCSSDEGIFSVDTATIAEKLGSFEYFTVTDLYLGLTSTISSTCYGIWISQQFNTTISNSITIRPNDTNTKNIFIQYNAPRSGEIYATAYLKDGTTKTVSGTLNYISETYPSLYNLMTISRDNGDSVDIDGIAYEQWASVPLVSTSTADDTFALFTNTNITNVEKIEIQEVQPGTTTYGNVFAFHEEKNTTLEPGQLGVEYTDSGKPRLKVGDGTSTKDWSELSYLENPSISTTTTTTTGTSGGTRYTDTTLTNEFSRVNIDGTTTETGDIGLELKTETYSNNSITYPKVSVLPHNTFDETGITLGSEDKPFEELYAKGISLDEDTYISSNGSGRLTIEQGNGGINLNTTSSLTSLYPNSETVSNYLGTSSMPWDTGYVTTLYSNSIIFKDDLFNLYRSIAANQPVTTDVYIGVNDRGSMARQGAYLHNYLYMSGSGYYSEVSFCPYLILASGLSSARHTADLGSIGSYWDNTYCHSIHTEEIYGNTDDCTVTVHPGDEAQGLSFQLVGAYDTVTLRPMANAGISTKHCIGYSAQLEPELNRDYTTPSSASLTGEHAIMDYGFFDKLYANELTIADPEYKIGMWFESDESGCEGVTHFRSVSSSEQFTTFKDAEYYADIYLETTVYPPSVTHGEADSSVGIMYSASRGYFGRSSSPWTQGYIAYCYLSRLAPLNNSYPIFSSGDLAPATPSTSTTTGYTLGDSTYKWRYLYAYSGTIQTSDRSAKSDIKYLSNNEVATMSTDSDTDTTNITMNDVVDFVKELEPATFCYKDGNGDNPTEAESSPEMIQLGLIADDICNSKLFKYVGVETEADDIIEPEQVDEETGEVTREAVIAEEKKTVRGLQAIPLATAALTCCKYLLSEIENLREELSELKSAE